MMKFSEIKDKYELEIGFEAKKEKNVFGNLLKTDRLSVMFSPEGNIEFIKYEDKYVYVKLFGACSHCGYQDFTLNNNILLMLATIFMLSSDCSGGLNSGFVPFLSS